MFRLILSKKRKVESEFDFKKARNRSKKLEQTDLYIEDPA